MDAICWMSTFVRTGLLYSEQTNVFLQRGLLVWLGMFIEKSL